MKKSNLRSMGFGFLCASILTGAFAVYGQGNVPIPGITVNSLFNTSQENDTELTKYREELSKAQDEKQKLENEKKKLTESVTGLEAQVKKLTEEKDAISSANSIKPTDSEETTTETTVESETTVQDVSEASTVEAGTMGTFTISEGELSSEIADRLQAEGFITSSTELQELIATWSLDSMILSGDYELTSDMTVHQVAEIITDGAYYYIP